MNHQLKPRKGCNTLGIHCTEESFCFGFRKGNNLESDALFIKKFDHNLCNDLVFDFKKFIFKKNLQNVNKISVSIGPANFNASRLIVVLARTISQQINCPLLSFSSFEVIAKRIASKNNIIQKKQSFWIYKKLKREGFIAGKYEVVNNEEFFIREKVIPKVIKEFDGEEPFFEAEYRDKEDLKELLDLSNKNLLNSNLSSWQKVLPLYPISPIN